MKPVPVTPHGVPASTRDGWRPFEHRVLSRRATVPRGLRRRRTAHSTPVRDGIETWHSPRRLGHFLGGALAVALGILAVLDLVADASLLHVVALVGAVLLAGTGSLLAVAAAEPAGLYPGYARRWQLQAIASALLMFMLMIDVGDP